jgi:hypothetical protein
VIDSLNQIEIERVGGEACRFDEADRVAPSQAGRLANDGLAGRLCPKTGPLAGPRPPRTEALAHGISSRLHSADLTAVAALCERVSISRYEDRHIGGGAQLVRPHRTDALTTSP